MAGTKEGGQKAKATTLAKYGEDFYVRTGRMGGSAKVSKGFGKMPKAKVRAAGRKGGQISRRGLGKKTILRELEEFQKGFNQPTTRDKLLARLRR